MIIGTGSGHHRVSPEVSMKNPDATLTPKLPTNVANSKKGHLMNGPTRKFPFERTLTPAQAARNAAYKRAVLSLLESKWFTVMMLIVTLYALFGDDIRLSLFSLPADNGFYTLASICLVLFSFEFIASCYAKPGYIMSFYFLLDLIATFSVLPDIGWIWNEIIGTNTSSSAIKASKATKAGSKAGRIVRVVRAVRLFRVVKILKWKNSSTTEPLEQLQESKVGSKMGEVTVQRVVVLVLFLIMLLPVFDGGYTQVEYRYQDYGLRIIHMLVSSGMSKGSIDSSTEYARLLSGYVQDAGMLLYIQMTNVTNEKLLADIASIRFQESPSLPRNLSVNPVNSWSASNMLASYSAVTDLYRDVEINIVKTYGCFNKKFVAIDSADVSSACMSIAIFDIASTSASSASYNILKTCFIIVVLVAASTSFIRTARILVLDPIERMMDVVKKLAANPLASVQTSRNDALIRKNANEQGFETALLELTLSKVGRLMQVGFGAAGADIIGKNMGSGDLDPMLPGKKITAIYGFCDIRQFTDTTECLQEEVMVYVNKLGDIMHTGTHHYYGMANKNVGDAFLLSWKLCDGEMACFSRFTDTPTEIDRQQVNQSILCPPNLGAGTKPRRITPTEMADSALTAFIKCMIDLDNANTKGSLTEYLTRDVVVKRFGPNFRIKMGFGMHVGWAVEGAIGSRFKIDATYISPHVEMADRLEAGSKMFMTPINISHWFAALISPAARRLLRKMDQISIRGVDTPLTVYTFDVTVMKPGFGTPKIDSVTGCQLPVDFENDPEYLEIRKGLEPAFLEAAASAVESYLSGDWSKARQYLTTAQQIRPQDGPCKYLMEVLKEYNYETPRDWKGYRFVAGY
ncbi:voltage-gated ion channel superfamily [Plasmopara halstedii]|uniref:Voltage-gated ion channel superfamily n=1 Tax=Plasmopara halstedii TaxID=4781 RepID=A0A0P1AX26_PLAHL|nr:voltage-gated ion channel superfamily [Plasmopara halstedii]CEG45320.1 voltage-gated ion channel superfamily [Plasmopara halstedii]|eukprot:XP_024581689.1 voltage-gated ion channel superfamily [Plasmopara halstedii]